MFPEKYYRIQDSSYSFVFATPIHYQINSERFFKYFYQVFVDIRHHLTFVFENLEETHICRHNLNQSNKYTYSINIYAS